MKRHKLTQEILMSAIDWCYYNAVKGIPGILSAVELGESFKKRKGSDRDKVNSLIRWQNIKAGTTGFVTGLGGIITMPVTIPVNLASILFIQIRMIAAIAYIGGNDLNDDDRVKTLVYICLAGNSGKEILKDTGIALGNKITRNAIKSISGETIKRINQKVGFKLFTKFGEKGIINLGKAIPLVGGIVSGSFDSFSTNLIGNIARNTFIE